MSASKPPAVIRPAWAKINLYLEVTGRRPNGYHELDSLIVFAGLGDRLVLEAADTLELSVTGRHAKGVPSDSSNLVMAAAEALRQASGTRQGARVRLEKRIPVAAGVGGGSADAAATLEGLRQLWKLKISDRDLRELSLGLGADVPVCLFGLPALVQGIGEVIERAPPLPPVWLDLVNPGVSLSTPAVFKARSGDFTQARPWPGGAETAAQLADLLRGWRNDLQPPAAGLAPVVETVLAKLGALPGALFSRMSGSGATCFALFSSAKEAKSAAASLSAEQPDWWVAAAPLLHGKLSDEWRRDTRPAAG